MNFCLPALNEPTFEQFFKPSSHGHHDLIFVLLLVRRCPQPSLWSRCGDPARMVSNVKMGTKTSPTLPLRTTTPTSGGQRPMNGLDCFLHNGRMAVTSALTIRQ